MNTNNMIEIQKQVRENQAELHDFLQDLNQWQSDIKQKDENLKKQSSVCDSEKLPPVRNILHEKKKKKKIKTATQASDGEPDKVKKIKAYDYRAWDKFDVDKACEDIEAEEKQSSEYETDEEWEAERRKQQAIMLKEKGNKFLKEGKLNEAVESYTQGMIADPYNALLPANRAMGLIKQGKMAAAEADCSTAISLDPTYLKAYLRRGSARKGQKKYEEATKDFKHVLKLEPNNRQAKEELCKIEHILNPLLDEESGIVKPVYKQELERSKKPLRRIKIEEINVNDDAVKNTVLVAKSTHKVESQENGQNNCDLSKSNTVNSNAEKDTKSTQFDRLTIPPVPASSFQFLTDYQSLCNSPEKLFNYFKKIPPVQYVKLFGEALDGDILAMLLYILNTFYIPAKLEIYPVLKHLTCVKRFSVTSLFLSIKDKTVLADLFEHLRVSENVNTADIDELVKKYGV